MRLALRVSIPLVVAAVALPLATLAAQPEKVLNLEEYGRWNRINAASISNDGKWMTFTYAPNEGDPTLHVNAIDGDRRAHRHARHSHADRRARPRGGHRGVFGDAWLAREGAPWHPHLHLLVTYGGFRPDGTFVSWPVHDTARVTAAFRRAVLRLFVRLDLFDEDQAAGMLTWPHAGFHVHTAVWEGPFGSPRTIAPSRPASRATAPAIPWRWSGSPTTEPRRP